MKFLIALLRKLFRIPDPKPVKREKSPAY